jgi:RNA polymerase sigma-70 factor (ECF subfamily)
VAKNRLRPSLVWTSAMIATLRPDVTRMSEATLETPALSAARQAFVAHAEAGVDRAYRLAGLILGNASDAEDVVGDAIERAWRDIDGLRDPDRFQAWFDRIVVNGCRDHLRRRRRIGFIQLVGDLSPQVADPFGSVLDGDATTRAMQVLTADERIVVVLHFWADLTLESVAERLDWRVGTVKSRLHRALVRMRDHAASLDRPGGLV